jgi:hypothetical protein
VKLEDGTPYTSPECEEASEQDRLWFDGQPQRTACLRPALPGEFPPRLADDCPYVLVWQVVPGLRLRQPVRLLVLPEANSCN